MWQYIILVLIFAIVINFNNQKNNEIQSLQQSSQNKTFQPYSKAKKRSLWEIIVSANKAKNYYKDRGITVKGSNKPDSDTSACVGITKSDKDMIITKFAGYVLEYPCTVNQRGEYHIEYNPDNTILSQRYRLNISVVLGQENGSIWWSGNYDDLTNTQGFIIQLISNGKKRSNMPIEDWIKSANKIKEIDEANLIIFRKGNYVRAFIKDLFESKKAYVSIRCDLTQDADLYKLFSPFHDIGNKSRCSASWRLTDDITLGVLRIQSKYAYQFYKIYEELNKNIYSIFIEYPTQTTGKIIWQLIHLHYPNN